MKISVVIPVYNVEKYLKKCLDSVINQTLKDIEIIIVNDGSPDNSQAIIDEYAKKDRRIIPLIQENGRQGKARNTGLKHAKGEYISFIDSDDYIEIDMLEKMYDNAKLENSDVVICSFYKHYGKKKNHISINDNLILDTISNNNPKLFNTFGPCSKIYKRDLLIKNNIKFMEKVYYEDVSFTLKVLTLAKKISFVNEPLYNYIIREGSTMNSNNAIRNLDIIIAFDDVIEYFENKKIYNKYYSEIEYLAIDGVFISATLRVICSSARRKDKIKVINQLRKFMFENFKNFKKNKYLKQLIFIKKIEFRLIILKQYGLINLICKLKTIRRNKFGRK